jgi:hypothetical protein
VKSKYDLTDSQCYLNFHQFLIHYLTQFFIHWHNFSILNWIYYMVWKCLNLSK